MIAIIDKLGIVVATGAFDGFYISSTASNDMANDNFEADLYMSRSLENIAYIRQMLGELHVVAEREGAEMLCYLIGMAYVEAGGLQSGRRSLSAEAGQRHKSPRVPF